MAEEHSIVQDADSLPAHLNTRRYTRLVKGSANAKCASNNLFELGNHAYGMNKLLFCLFISCKFVVASQVFWLHLSISQHVSKLSSRCAEVRKLRN
jgi:hypothetical protein